MDSLDLWGAIAASILLAQCIVWNLLLVALALGLWFGSDWLYKKTGIASAKVSALMAQAQYYARLGQSYLVAPFVRLRGRVVGLRTFWDRLEK